MKNPYLKIKDIDNFIYNCERFRLDMVRIRDKSIPGSNNELFLQNVIKFVSETHDIAYSMRHDCHWNRINSEFYEYLVIKNKEQHENIIQLNDTIESLNSIISEMESKIDSLNNNPFVKAQ